VSIGGFLNFLYEWKEKLEMNALQMTYRIHNYTLSS